MITRTDPQQQSAAEYHADYSAVSNSMLSVFRQSRQRYRDRFVTRTMSPPGPTPAMRLGSLLHLRALEPERYVCLDVRDTRCQAPLASGARKGEPCGATSRGQSADGRWLCGAHSKGAPRTEPSS